MTLIINASAKFKKDIKCVINQRQNLSDIKEVLDKLTNKETL